MRASYLRKNSQSMQGITFLGILFVAFFVILSALVAMSLVPPYVQFYEVKDALDQLSSDPKVSHMTKAQVKNLFERKLQVNSINNIKGENLEVEKNDGKMILNLHYEVRVHVIANIDAILNFKREATVQ